MRHFGPVGLVVVAASEITIPMLTLCVSEPLVPVIVSVKDPVDAEDEALAVSVEVAGVPGAGVTGPGRLIVTPVGADNQA
jgi:hypothetical protein